MSKNCDHCVQIMPVSERSLKECQIVAFRGMSDCCQLYIRSVAETTIDQEHIKSTKRKELMLYNSDET